ncbi:MAG: short-chain dehydrogenase [Planctomyces sp.]|nr:short-chain dehydrogenase [Planctomyces sp.]
MQIDYADGHVVVTGGAGALGAAVVRRLIDAGAVVSVPAHDEHELRRFELRSHERVRVFLGVDCADEAALARFYADALGRPPEGKRDTGGLWAAVHLAGGFAMGPFEETSLADFQAQWRTNVLTAFLSSREAVKLFKSRPSTPGGGPAGGRIVNVVARPALEPRLGAGMVAYTTTKAALAAMTQALAEEVVRDGVLVNAVAPSVMDTPANRKAMPSADFSAWAPLPDVAATIAFLASPQNTVTRGGIVPVYGRS